MMEHHYKCDIGRNSVATTSVREFPENYRRQYFGDYQFEVAYGLASFFGHYTQKVCEEQSIEPFFA